MFAYLPLAQEKSKVIINVGYAYRSTFSITIPSRSVNDHRSNELLHRVVYGGHCIVYQDKYINQSKTCVG